MKRLILPLLFSILLIPQAKADHFIGSDFTWECLGNDTFKIILTFYQDCNGCHVGVRPTGCTWELCGLPLLAINSSCGSKTANFTQKSHEDITPVCDEQCTRCTDCDCTFQFGIRKHVLETIVYLGTERKNGCCEFTMSYNSCCRSTAITTGAANNSFYVDAQLNACQTPCDNSPKFTNAPIAILCLGRDFIYNQGVVDNDVDTITGGLIDSLVYSFASPMSSATQATPWSSSYSYDKPLNYLGFPKKNLKFPKGIHLDTFTGDLMFRPMKQEITVLAIKIEQYRNGKKISETRRDVQIIVIKCPDNEPPVISGMNCTKPLTKNFKTTACADETICFTVCTSDKNKDDTVTISWNAGIPGATFKILNKGGKRENGQFCWTPTEAQVSKFPYSFVVTAKDNACPVNGFTARSFQITVKEPPKAVYDTLIYDCGNAEFSVKKTGRINVAQYMWVLNGNQKIRKGADFDTVNTKFKYPGRKPFTLTVIGKNGCNKIYEDTVTVPKFINITINSDTTVCSGTTLNFASKIQDSASAVTHWWSNGETKKRYTSLTVGNRDTFIVAYVKDNQCDNSDTCFIKVNTPPVFDLGNTVRICPSDKYIVRPNATWDTTETDTVFKYNWFQGKARSYLLESDSLVVADSSMYYAIASDSLNCKSTDSIMVFVNPERDWLPRDKTICFGDTAVFKVNDSTPVSKFTWYNSPKDTANSIKTGNWFKDNPGASKWYGIKWKETIHNLTCFAYDSFSVKVNPLPVITFLPEVELCENYGEYSLSLTGSPYGGIWEDTAKNRDYVRNNKFNTEMAGTINGQNTRHLLSYTFEESQTGCEKTEFHHITVKPLPEVELSVDTIFLCNTEIERELDQYVVKVKNRGSWTGNGLVSEGGKTYFRISEVGTGPNTYMLIYEYTNATGSQPHCTNYDTLIAKVIEVPKVIAGAYDSVCIDSDPILLNNAKPSGKQGAWYYNGTNGSVRIPINESLNPSDYGVGEHNLTYLYKVKNSECADSATTTISINPLPKPIITTIWQRVEDENRICISEDNKVFEGNTKDDNSDFTIMKWLVNYEEKNEFNPKEAGLGQHEIKYAVINIFGCESDTSESVVVDDAKSVVFENGLVCLGDDIELNATATNASRVEFITDGEGTFSNIMDLAAVYKPLGNDLVSPFKITAKTNNPDNICPEAEFSNELVVHPIPQVRFTQSDTLGCAPLNVEFKNLSTISNGSITTARFYFGNGQEKDVRDTNAVLKTTYGVIGTNDRYIGKLVATSNEGCKDSASFITTTLLRPKAAFVPKPGKTTIINPNVLFENKSEYVINTKSYNWNFGDTLTAGGGESVEINTHYLYSSIGKYNVVLKVYNRHEHQGITIDCVDSMVQTIVIDPEVLVYIPNVFSPNNDGPESNNEFKPIVSDQTSYFVKVFNRWGEVMWQSENPEESWDGTFKGQPCQEGVYLYLVRVANAQSQEFKFTGTVTLLR
ncbi:MAG: gliding motility-associated C-terminal domain-containing protein [Bacteroidia bacterium]